MMRHLIRRLGLPALAAVVILSGCDRSSPERSDRATAPATETAAPRRAPDNVPTDGRRSVLNENEQQSPLGLTVARDGPDPSMRLQAIETRGREPGETLDLLTYALVDPDESVRVRAQELLEEELARR